MTVYAKYFKIVTAIANYMYHPPRPLYNSVDLLNTINECVHHGCSLGLGITRLIHLHRTSKFKLIT